MNVLITGTSSGIGRETAIKCLEEGFTVYGLDIKKTTINHYNYYHFQVDVSDKDSLPELNSIDYISYSLLETNFASSNTSCKSLNAPINKLLPKKLIFVFNSSSCFFIASLINKT